jgi:hypothetical protein
MELSPVYVAQISLHYEERPTIIHNWTREQYAAEIAQRDQYPNWYFRRVTYAAASQIIEENRRNAIKSAYSKAIQEKYNVSANWEQNRWFVEQVRPTI